MAAHEHILGNFSSTLIILANDTAKAPANLQQSLDSFAIAVLHNRMALDYILVEQGGICTIANTSYCMYINTSAQFETTIERICQ